MQPPITADRIPSAMSFATSSHRPVTVLGTLVASFALAAVTHAHAQTRPVELDVKTPFAEKLALTAIKNGAVLLLDESGWATTTELGEDYALWIRNGERDERADSIEIAFDVELRVPATFGDGALIASRRVRLVYPRRMSWREHAPAPVEEFVGDVERYASYGLDAVRILATPVTSFAIARALDLVEGELPGGTLEVAKLEAMIAGARIVLEARALVDAARAAAGTDQAAAGTAAPADTAADEVDATGATTGEE